ncbi:MAG: hypothetical protein Q7Q73_05060 [Verrucomicrobiota bacterium JB024]|nr:hypothetical protein [Verrucomicrobiota bacterium JB024]
MSTFMIQPIEHHRNSQQPSTDSLLDHISASTIEAYLDPEHGRMKELSLGDVQGVATLLTPD